MLTLSMVALVVLLMTSVTVLDISRARGIYREERETLVLLIASTLNDTLADPLYFVNMYQIQAISQTVASQPDILYVLVYTPDGRVLVDTRVEQYAVGTVGDGIGLQAVQSGQAARRYDDASLVVASPVKIGRNVIGGVQFAFDGQSLNAEIRQIVIQNVWQGSALIGLGVVLSILIAQHFARPIKKLLLATEQITEGDFKYSATGRRTDEIGELAVAFGEITVEVAERKAAEGKIKASLQEKEVLLREIHHRVKNNLQVVSSLLNLQSKRIKDERIIEPLRDSQNRILSMALVHEKLYGSEDLTKIDFAEYCQSLGRDVLSSFGEKSNGLSLKLDIDDIGLSITSAIPCGLIINELISNSLKHAFPSDGGGEISIGLHRVEEKMVLVVGDNGVGFPEDLDFRNTKSLGLQLVSTLSAQLGGSIELDRSGGSKFKVTFTDAKYSGGGSKHE